MPLRRGDAAGVIPAGGLLSELAQLWSGVLQLVELPFGLVLDGRADAAETVEVLDLHDAGWRRCGRRRPRDMDVDVGVAAETAFLHVAVGDFDVAQQQSQFFEVGVSLVPELMSGLRDDFEQGCAGPVQVDLAVAAAARFVVQVFAGILFEVGPDDADLFFGAKSSSDRARQ